MPGLRRRTLSAQVKFGSVTISMFLIFFFCLIALLSLRHFIDSTTSGYRLRELEDQREKLLTENEINAMLVDKVRALSAIEQSEVVRRMIKPHTDNIVYIYDDFAMAKR